MDSSVAPALCPARALSDGTRTALPINVITERVSLDGVSDFVAPEVNYFYTP